jgi:hypothetical protein
MSNFFSEQGRTRVYAETPTLVGVAGENPRRTPLRGKRAIYGWKLDRMSGKFLVFFGCLFLIGISAAESIGGSDIGLSKGQTIYVPSYPHVYHTDRERPYYLTTTLCIRNADPALPIKIVSVEYFDSDGNLLKSYVDKTVTIAPMASTQYSVKESDKAGGFGAKFLVKWVSDSIANEPIVECVMIGTSGQQGISFLSTGRVIRDER